VSQSSWVGADLSEVFFTDNNTGTLIGLDGTILRTTNGGTTWVIQSTGTSGRQGYLNHVFLTDANTGTVVGLDGSILHTTNGGATWTSQSCGTSTDFIGVYFADENTGLILGTAAPYSGRIMEGQRGIGSQTERRKPSVPCISPICTPERLSAIMA